jgi:hypothetical protein
MEHSTKTLLNQQVEQRRNKSSYYGDAPFEISAIFAVH